ncbi:MAG: amino acid permease [Alphaproteobacteria bacterium]|nr:amino acid permease [Alphaproteobacteria bacterium]MBV9371829.1 amino acid permease [Alphaproteobacteria bacterium]MBV9900549.1 amino acid permease [Alphaproteobacteria bacterium]
MIPTRDEPLRRDIGFFGSAFLSFNGLVGAGIFALPATLYTQFGSFSPFLFPVFGLLVLVVALPFARVAARHRESGGPVVYAATFGPVAAFQAGWIYYVARATALAANATVLVSYLASWSPALAGGWPRAAIILILCGLVTLINVIGVRKAIRALDVLTVLKALPLIAVALIGLALAGGIEPPGAPPPLDEAGAAALLILYAFVGFENSVVPAGETADPTRTLPRALIATIVATALLYFLVQLSYVAVMEPGANPAPMVAFGAALLGPAGALLLTATAICSLLGNISGGMTGTTRTTYAMARDGLLPGWFGRVSARYATPANSILFMGGLIAVLALSGSFVWLAVVSTLARMFVYAISIASLVRGQRPSPALWLLMAAGIAVCLWAACQSTWPSWRMLLILAAAGTLLYILARLARFRTGPETRAAANADIVSGR